MGTESFQAVYRVENEYGEGPYNASSRPEAVMSVVGCHGDSSGHPSPYEDGIDGERLGEDTVLCGFNSEEQLYYW